MQIYPAPVSQRLAASGGSAPVSLLEIQTLSGDRFYWSDANVVAPSLLALYDVSPPPTVTFLPWLLGEPSFHSYKSTQTTTGTASVQNLTGDTVRRDTSLLFTKEEFIGAMFTYRYWMTDCEFALKIYQGIVDDVELSADGDDMTLTFEGLSSWAKIPAPDAQIGVSCPLTFASIACGSTSPTPCQQNYGTCTSVERFQGIVLEWTGASFNYSQYVQPEPLRIYNGRIAN